MSLRIDIEKLLGVPSTARVALAGVLDGTTAPRLEEALEPLLGTTRHLVLDLSELRFISSAGLRVLFNARKRLGAESGSLAMTRVPPQIAKVFEIVGAIPSFEIFRDEAELDAYLAAMQRRHAGPAPD